MSAQKALIAKIRKDAALLKRSCIAKLEDALATQMVDKKHEIVGRTIITEYSNMMRSSRKLAQTRRNNNTNQLLDLRELQNKNLTLLKIF